MRGRVVVFSQAPARRDASKMKFSEGAEGSPPQVLMKTMWLSRWFSGKTIHIWNPENYDQAHTQDRVNCTLRESITESEGGQDCPPPLTRIPESPRASFNKELAVLKDG